jgi:signal transduction histidine kinase
MPEDDERQDVTSGHGLGLESMRVRAQQIGAEIDWNPVEPHGTQVEIRFSPGATDRRVAS